MHPTSRSPAEPGDYELITRGEHRRAIILFSERISRVEAFLFEDRLGPNGEVERLSLEHFVERVDAHITVACTWARVARTLALGVSTFGGAVVVGHSVYQAMFG